MRPSRLVVPAALALLIGQAAVIAIRGNDPPGPLISDVIQLFLGILTTVAALQAAQRSDTFGRVFWRLAASSFAVWCAGQILGTYYGSIRNLPTQSLWNVEVFYFAAPAPLAMCLFLDPVAEREGLDWERILDYAQVAIVFVLLYFYFSNLPTHGTALGAWRLSLTTDGLTTAGFLFRYFSARKDPASKLFLGMGCFRLTAVLTDLYFVLGLPEQVTGAWFDLAWSLPWLIPLYSAATWQKEKALTTVGTIQLRERRLQVTHFLPLIFPLLVIVMAAEVARGQLLVAGIAVLLSLGISYARLIFTHREQQRSSEALRQQHSLLEAIIEGTTEAIYVKDRQGRYLMINSAGARSIGQPVQEILGKSDSELFSPDSAASIMERDRELMEDGIMRTYEETGKADGVRRTYLSTKGPYRDARGRVIGLVGISVDITERYQAAEALAESEERFRTIFDGSPVGMVVIGMDGRVVTSNTACRKMLGIGEQEILTTEVFDALTHPEHREPDAARYRELAAGAIGQIRQEKRYILRDGRTAWADLLLYLLRGRNGEPRYIIGMAIDISEQKLLETQLRQSQRMETIGRLAGGMAHDFNNLLTVIKGYCDLVLDRTQSDPLLHNQIEHIEKASDQAASLTRQLLAFSRQQVLEPRVFNLNALVLNAKKMLQRLIGEDIEMVTLTAENLGAVKADPGQIEQVILNLVVNARDAMPNGGKLMLETANVDLDEAFAQAHLGAKPGKHVMLAVTDTGTGMNEETIAHIFEPFFTTKELGKGTGLGLSMVYGIVKQSGGHIWLTSELGKGTIFKTYLPRVDEPVEETRRALRPMEAAQGSETILLVEDDPQVRELTRDILKMRGYDVLVTSGPGEALEVCKQRTGPIHLLLTDVVMPGMNGSEMATQMAVLRPGIKVMFMSGYTDNAVLQDGRLSKGLFFLQKPFTPSALGKKVRDILDHQAR